LEKPTISCGTSSPTSIDIQVCAGGTGAPAGFSIQWQTLADFQQFGWSADSGCPLDINGSPTCGSSFCKASFSGVPGCSNYKLGPNACTTVQIGDNLFDDCGASSTCANQPLECNTFYVFRAFAHNVPQGLNKSDFSATLTCKTAPCGGGTNCTFTQGSWKTHGPTDCNPSGGVNVWPVASLTVGTVSYTDAQLCSIFNTPPAGGNGLISLAHQLIATKLNIANGADGSSIAATVTAADSLIGGLLIPPVGSGFLPTATTSSLTTTLDSYNKGLTGPGHCE
jgi:hypothetical protein